MGDHGPDTLYANPHNLSLCWKHRFFPGLSLDEHSRFEQYSDRNPNLEASTKAATMVIGRSTPYHWFFNHRERSLGDRHQCE
jgi:hypothetical protein